MSDEEWGPWIEHDGAGCPCVGMWVRAQGIPKPGENIVDYEFLAQDFAEWYWSLFGTIGRGQNGQRRICGKVIRYRIRKPRALIEMIERAREMDDAPEGPVRAPEKVTV